MAASPKSFVQFPFKNTGRQDSSERGDPVRFVESTFEAKIYGVFCCVKEVQLQGALLCLSWHIVQKANNKA